MASKFNIGKRWRVAGHEYRKMDFGAALWWGCSCENRFCQKGGTLPLKNHSILRINVLKRTPTCLNGVERFRKEWFRGEQSKNDNKKIVPWLGLKIEVSGAIKNMVQYDTFPPNMKVVRVKVDVQRHSRMHLRVGSMGARTAKLEARIRRRLAPRHPRIPSAATVSGCR